MGIAYDFDFKNNNKKPTANKEKHAFLFIYIYAHAEVFRVGTVHQVFHVATVLIFCGSSTS